MIDLYAGFLGSVTAFTPKKTIEDIVPEARPRFQELLDTATDLGMQPKIVSAGRTCADQNALHASGPQTTKAAGCSSWHVLGRALDISLKPDSCATYTKLGEVWEGMGGIWGGRFAGFGGCGDAMHFQWAKTGAVPQSVCPSDANCDEVREAYLSQAFAQSPSSIGSGLGRALLIVGAVVGVVWWFR